MRTIFKKIVILILCVLIIFPASFAYAENDVEGATNEEYWSDMNFSELTYYDVTIEDFEKLYEEINTATTNNESQDVIDGLLNKFKELYDAAEGNCELADYNWSNHYYDEEYKENYYQYLDIETRAKEMLSELKGNSAPSEIPDTNTKINGLLEKYNQAMAEDYYVSFEDDEINYDDIISMNDKGTISEDEREDLLAKYWEKYDAAVSEAFVDVIQARNEYARSLGYQDYIEFYYDNFKNYTLEQMDAVADMIYDKFLPLYLELVNYADTSIYSQIKVPMNESRMIEATYQSLEKMDPQLLEPMDYMLEHELFNIEDSGQKTTQFYGQVYLLKEQPTILLCINPLNRLTDYFTFQHEIGHYLNCYFFHDFTTDGSYDEIMSCTLQLLLAEEMNGAFTEEEQIKIINDNILDTLRSIADGACGYRFERQLYSDNELSKDSISKYFYENFHGYARVENEEHRWNRWLYCETVINMSMCSEIYSLSSLAAVQLWMQYEENKENAVSIYKAFLQNSYGTDYSTAVQNAGLQNPLSTFNSDEICEFLRNKFIYEPLIDRNTENPEAEVLDQDKNNQGLELAATDTADKETRVSQLTEDTSMDSNSTANTGEEDKNSDLYLIFTVACLGISLFTIKRKQVNGKA